MPIEKVNLAQKFDQISETWTPKIAGMVNDFAVKLAKLHGEFVWYHHDDTDEMFLVVKGRLCIRLRDGDIWLDEGEFVVIPHGVEHLPVAEDEVHLLMFEPAGTRNTGNVENEWTVNDLETL